MFARDGSARKWRETNRFAILSSISLSNPNLRSFPGGISFPPTKTQRLIRARSTFQCNSRRNTYLNKLENKLSCNKITRKRRYVRWFFLTFYYIETEIFYLNVSFISTSEHQLVTRYDSFQLSISFLSG